MQNWQCRRRGVTRPRATVLLSWVLLAASAFLGGCAGVGPRSDGRNAVAWMQTSPEYAAAAFATYASAAAALASFDASGVTAARSPAIVLDVDETVLDNSAYQAQLILDGSEYQEDTWDRWVALRAAAPLPGAVEFLRAARASGFDVFFITNRRCAARQGTADACPQKDDTLFNLRSAGISVQPDHLLLRGDVPPSPCIALLSEAERGPGIWSASDKTSRRRCVEQSHAVVMLLGDQIGDFVGAEAESALAADPAEMQAYAARWGTSWFMLPNPAYGSWLNRLQPDALAHLRGLAGADDGP